MSMAMILATFWQRLEFPVYQTALSGGMAVAIACGILSVFVVLKRMAFVGEGISHSAFGGMGVALLVQVAMSAAGASLGGMAGGGVLLRDAIVAVFCVGSAVAIGGLSRRGKLTEDTAIGIVMGCTMALGVVLLDIHQWVSTNPVPSLHSTLFGSIFYIEPVEVWLAWALAAVVALAVTLGFRQLVFYAFDEETATVFGVRTGAIHYGFLVLLGLTVVAAMRTMGVILASAMLILPGATARLWSGRIERVTVLSALLAVAGVVGGLLLAIWLGQISAEPIIVLTLVVVFAVSYAVRGLARRRGASK